MNLSEKRLKEIIQSEIRAFFERMNTDGTAKTAEPRPKKPSKPKQEGRPCVSR